MIHTTSPTHLMEESDFFIDKECVGSPDELDVFCTDNKLLQIILAVEGQSGDLVIYK